MRSQNNLIIRGFRHKAAAMLLIANMLFVSISFAQKSPFWTMESYRTSEYPSSEYFVAYLISGYAKQDDVNQKLASMREQVRAEIAKQISIDIHNKTEIVKQKSNDKSTMQVMQHSASESNLKQLPAMKTEVWGDTKNRAVHGFAVISKQDLKNKFLSAYREKADIAQLQYKQGISYYEEGRNERSLKAFLESQKNLQEAKGKLGILMLVSNVDYLGELIELQNKLDISLSKVLNQKNRTIEGLCAILAYSLKQQPLEGTLTISPFTFEETGVASSLSNRIKTELAKELSGLPNLQCVSYDNIDALSTVKVLGGTIWEDNNELKILANIADPKTGIIESSAEGYLSTEFVKNAGLKWKPDNLSQNQRIINQLEASLESQGGINVEVFTNKGKDNPTFTEGEELRLYTRVSYQCYIRMIYVLADGQKTLLLDNHYIDETKVNQMYPISEVFECAPPFGLEHLKIYASSEKFPSLNTFEVSGYQFIRDGASNITTKTRGVKKSGSRLWGEADMSITTMKK